MTIDLSPTKAEIQATRIRVAAAIANMNASQLHQALVESGYPVEYETVRRAYAGERKSELPYSFISSVANVTGCPIEFVAGEADVDYPGRAKGVYLSSVSLAVAV